MDFFLFTRFYFSCRRDNVQPVARKYHSLKGTLRRFSIQGLFLSTWGHKRHDPGVFFVSDLLHVYIRFFELYLWRHVPLTSRFPDYKAAGDYSCSLTFCSTLFPHSATPITCLRVVLWHLPANISSWTMTILPLSRSQKCSMVWTSLRQTCPGNLLQDSRIQDSVDAGCLSRK